MVLPELPECPPPLSLPEAVEQQTILEHDGLLDHEQLVQALYLSEGLDFFDVQSQAKKFLQDIGLRPHDLGVANVDEEGRVLLNQCFYLSIAHSYLGQESSDQVPGLALRFKHAIEAAVLSKRPEWAVSSDDSGSNDLEGRMAFADFLPIAMHSSESEDEQNLVSELAVCVLDSVDGHVEVYIGPKYAEQEKEALQRNLILLWYTPGHYQCLVCDDGSGSKVVMTYDEFKEILSQHGVLYIETTE